jgi:hypothetical protein
MRAALHGCVGTALILSSAAAAHAQQEVPGQAPVGAHGNAFELGLAGGFAQGFGAASAGGTSAVLNPGAGAAVDADVGWRASSNLAIGVWGHGAQLGATGNPAPPATLRSIYQAAAGVGGTWHFRPSATDLDPWVALGTGWRAQWFGYTSGPSNAEHGLELVRGRVGLDLRVSRSIAVGPVVGGSMDAYLTQQLPSGGWVAVAGRPVAASFFAGLRGTLDVPLRGRQVRSQLP